MNQVFMRKLLYNKGYMIRIEHVYTETCKNCDFSVPPFATIKIILKYNSTIINFSNFIITHPENKLIDKSTFLTNNTDIKISKRKKLAHPPLELNLLAYLPRIIIKKSLSMLLQKKHPKIILKTSSNK